MTPGINRPVPRTTLLSRPLSSRQCLFRAEVAPCLMRAPRGTILRHAGEHGDGSRRVADPADPAALVIKPNTVEHGRSAWREDCEVVPPNDIERGDRA
jgi:hypothetical protein